MTVQSVHVPGSNSFQEIDGQSTNMKSCIDKIGRASQVALVVKNPLPMQEKYEIQVQVMSQEVPLEQEMATHSSILAWKIPWTEESDGLHTVHGAAESDTTE